MARFLLSIFSFKTVDYHSLRIPHGLLGSLFVLALIEGLLHLYENRLPDPVLWGNIETSSKVCQAKCLSINGDGVFDVLILGLSHARFGISPKVVQAGAKGLNLTVYNGALNGRTYPVLEFVLTHVYIPSLRPGILVLAVNPLVFNRHNTWMERNTLEFFEAPMPRALSAKGIAKVWRLFLTENIYLYRYRERHAGLSKGLLVNGVSLDECGYSSIEGIFDDKARARLQSPAHPYQTIMREFEFGGPSADAFIRILQHTKDLKIRIVVVNMPFREELLSISTSGEKDYQTFLKEMSALQHEYGFLWLDYQASIGFTDKDFRDVDHLNAQGAVKLSTQLGKDLAIFTKSISETFPFRIQ